jgi:hypothetical protein
MSFSSWLSRLSRFAGPSESLLKLLRGVGRIGRRLSRAPRLAARWVRESAREISSSPMSFAEISPWMRSRRWAVTSSGTRQKSKRMAKRCRSPTSTSHCPLLGASWLSHLSRSRDLPFLLHSTTEEHFIVTPFCVILSINSALLSLMRMGPRLQRPTIYCTLSVQSRYFVPGGEESINHRRAQAAPYSG